MTIKNPQTAKFLLGIALRHQQTGQISGEELMWFIRGVELQEELAETTKNYVQATKKYVHELQEKLLAAETELFLARQTDNTKDSEDSNTNDPS